VQWNPGLGGQVADPLRRRLHGEDPGLDGVALDPRFA
jgi:hypothetical protein